MNAHMQRHKKPGRALPYGDLVINRLAQVLLTIPGALVLLAYWQSWKDLTHLVYDVPSALAMCAYLSQILCEALAGQRYASWWARLIVMLPMSVVPVGREFFAWRISGHLTDMWAVALIQTTDLRLPRWERVAYWVPVPVALWIRWFAFDKNEHSDTFTALSAGTMMFVVYLSLLLLFRRARTSRPAGSPSLASESPDADAQQ
jgi:hypothetical protein